MKTYDQAQDELYVLLREAVEEEMAYDIIDLVEAGVPPKKIGEKLAKFMDVPHSKTDVDEWEEANFGPKDVQSVVEELAEQYYKGGY